MRCVLACLVFVVASGYAQLPVIGRPAAIAVNVTYAEWQPRGLALMYRKKLASGEGIGMYMTGQTEGEVLLKTASQDRFESQWFEGIPTMIGILYHPLADTKEMDVTVYILDAKLSKATPVFTRRFPAMANPRVNVDPSPSLDHAIFRVKHMDLKAGKQVLNHWVLTKGTERLIDSPDLDRAVAENWSGPVWTKDGTACYTQSEPGVTFTGLDLSNAIVERQLASLQLALVLEGGMTLELGGSPAPALGTPVLELMRSNVTLRPVRFQGAWQSPPLPSANLSPESANVIVSYANSKGPAASLWLSDGQRDAPRVLVSPNASKWWINPKRDSIAYLTDGALILRDIKAR